MKYLLGIYSLWITLFYIAFFTFSGDFIIGLYTIPYLVLAIICIVALAAWDIIANQHEKKARKYFLKLLYLNVPLVIFAFFVPLFNGNRTIEEILRYSIPMNFLMFVGLFITMPVLGYVAGTIVDFIAGSGDQLANIKSPALEKMRK